MLFLYYYFSHSNSLIVTSNRTQLRALGLHKHHQISTVVKRQHTCHRKKKKRTIKVRQSKDNPARRQTEMGYHGHGHGPGVEIERDEDTSQQLAIGFLTRSRSPAQGNLASSTMFVDVDVFCRSPQDPLFACRQLHTTAHTLPFLQLVFGSIATHPRNRSPRMPWPRFLMCVLSACYLAYVSNALHQSTLHRHTQHATHTCSVLSTLAKRKCPSQRRPKGRPPTRPSRSRNLRVGRIKSEERGDEKKRKKKKNGRGGRCRSSPLRLRAHPVPGSLNQTGPIFLFLLCCLSLTLPTLALEKRACVLFVRSRSSRLDDRCCCLFCPLVR